MSEHLGDMLPCRLRGCGEEFRLRQARDEHERGHPELCRNPLCRVAADNCLTRISDCCAQCTHRRTRQLQPLERAEPEPFCRSRLQVGLGHVMCSGPSGHDGPHRVGHYSWDGDSAVLEPSEPYLVPLPSPVVEEGDLVTVEGMPPFQIAAGEAERRGERLDPEAVERGRQVVKRLAAQADQERVDAAVAAGRAVPVTLGGVQIGIAWEDGLMELRLSPGQRRQLGLGLPPSPAQLSVAPTEVCCRLHEGGCTAEAPCCYSCPNLEDYRKVPCRHPDEVCEAAEHAVTHWHWVGPGGGEWVTGSPEPPDEEQRRRAVMRQVQDALTKTLCDSDGPCFSHTSGCSPSDCCCENCPQGDRLEQSPVARDLQPGPSGLGFPGVVHQDGRQQCMNCWLGKSPCSGPPCTTAVTYQAVEEERAGIGPCEPLAHYQIHAGGEVEQRRCTETQGCMLPPHRGPCSEGPRFRVSGESGL